MLGCFEGSEVPKNRLVEEERTSALRGYIAMGGRPAILATKGKSGEASLSGIGA